MERVWGSIRKEEKKEVQVHWGVVSWSGKTGRSGHCCHQVFGSFSHQQEVEEATLLECSLFDPKVLEKTKQQNRGGTLYLNFLK